VRYQAGNSGSARIVSAMRPVPAESAVHGKNGPEESSNGAVPAAAGTQLSEVTESAPLRAVALVVVTVRFAVVALLAGTDAGEPEP
jgi:hypothetical protein